ncbi:phosphatidate cytidylyltransferase [Microbacterium sp. NC79]|uniref:phosphatidate cytidylyltransferase n=1 Tax=Microbacterium sp. NC79 TaxID=2851009 RepID=UPI001C2BBD86|nr:phosphatidate cytidylyltransferase [Microbacterium sp. NC79]MBV0894699.1 phosphatidate cytidylyltransferase [Microbacterium sp. NC79]
MSADPQGDALESPLDAQHDAPSGSESKLGAPLEARRAEFRDQVAIAREHFEEVNEKIKQRTGRDLILAVLSGLVLAGVVLGALLFVPTVFAAIVIVVSGLATFELARAFETGGRKVDVWVQIVAAVALAATGYFGTALWQLWVMTFAVVAVLIVWRMVAQMAARDGRTYGDVLADIAAAGFIPIYVPFLLALVLVLQHQTNGAAWILTFIIVVVSADTGAYAVGVWIGKHPMVPRVSPKKTWEGFAGAATAAVIAATLLAYFVLDLPLWAGIVMGLVILITATLGDLGESLIKRDLGIKDMSSWIPGHGGLLDRLDSLLPSAVATLALCYWLTPLVGA